MRKAKRYLPALAASTFMVLAACDNHGERAAERSSEDGTAPLAESDSGLAGIPTGDGAPEDEELALAEDPGALLAAILEIEDQDERLDRASEFFAKLAETQPVLALRLLPEQLSSDQQRIWGLPVLVRLMLHGALEEAAQLARSRFGGELHNQAVEQCFTLLGHGDISPTQMFEFWEMMGDGGHRERAAGTFGNALARKDPVLAVKWLESFESGSVSPGSIVGRTPEDIMRQVDVASDPALRERLAGA